MLNELQGQVAPSESNPSTKTVQSNLDFSANFLFFEILRACAGIKSAVEILELNQEQEINLSATSIGNCLSGILAAAHHIEQTAETTQDIAKEARLSISELLGGVE